MAIRIQIRNGIASEWASVNPILMEGELAIEKDTRKFKIGNGIDNWNSLPYATQGETGKSIEFSWSGTSLGIRQEGASSYTYQNVRGQKGDRGNDLEFNWNGTQLGVREKGVGSYQYIDLKGAKGETGSVTNLTSQHITSALGYTPTDNTTVNAHIGRTDNPHTVTKAQIGLSNVDNIKQMPISDGTLESYAEKLNTTTGAINLNLGNVWYRNATENTTFTITNAKPGSHSFTLYIDMGATVRTLNFPASVKWIDDEIPDMTEANKTYVISFSTINSGGKWLGHFGGGY